VLAWVPLAVALALPGPVPARAQETPGTSLTVRTVPPIEGILFVVDEVAFRSDNQGVARAVMPAPGIYSLRVRSPALFGPQRRIEFVTWSDGVEQRSRDITLAGLVELSAGFDVAYVAREELWDSSGRRVAADLVDSLTVVDDSGARRTYPARTSGLQGPTALLWQRHPAGTRWLIGRRLVASPAGLASEEVSYRVDHATVNGRRIDAASEPFYPGDRQPWAVTLSGFEVSIAARPLLFGEPPRARLWLAHPDGTRQRLGAGERTVLLKPGRYLASALPALGARFSLPGPDRVEVAVIGLPDMVAIGAMAALLVGAAAWWRARRRAALPEEHPAQPRPARRDTGTPESSPSSPAAELVRVQLDDGRTIEGWIPQGAESANVMILEVTEVRDPEGREVVPRASDSFVAAARVQRLERIRAARAEPGAAMDEVGLAETGVE
jgi:hypothetical protein